MTKHRAAQLESYVLDFAYLIVLICALQSDGGWPWVAVMFSFIAAAYAADGVRALEGKV